MVLNLTSNRKDATSATHDQNQLWYERLDFNDKVEVEFAKRGLIDKVDHLEIKDESGRVVWSQKVFEFLENDKCPSCINPSLWVNAQNLHEHGLFKVVDGIYQIRGYDLTNITFIEGKTGWIIFDPLLSVETAQAAMQLMEKNFGKRPVKAVIISHCHIDHYGGIKGVISDEDVRNGVPVIAPEGFEEHAISENVFAGTAMLRRSMYQCGPLVESDEKGAISSGIGISQSTGKDSYISPTDIIKKTGEVREIDGIKMEFQMTPGTEAPAEMNTWFPEKKALWIAENCTGSLHNLYTIRGAQVRDGAAWAKYLLEAVELYGDKVEVSFQSHNWPHWGNEFVNNYIINTAAAYRFINDQTLLLINQGYTSDEIGDMLVDLPKDLAKNWYSRQYYGTVSHNSRAVYQKFIGFYDANPANLNKLPPEKRAKKMTEYFQTTNGIESVLRKAKEDYDNGEYRWVADITNTIVFADPDNKDARFLCADALEQLGYQAESGIWRNAYLTGAKELRDGNLRDMSVVFPVDPKKSFAAAPPELIFDYFGIVIDSVSAQNINLKFNINIEGFGNYLITVISGVLLYQPGVTAKDVDASLTLTKDDLVSTIFTGDKEASSRIKFEGDNSVLNQLTAHLAAFDPYFNIIEP